MREETGLDVTVGRLLYVCDHVAAGVVHLTFEVCRVGGVLGAVAVDLDTHPIRGVQFVRFRDLPALGFGQRFVDLAVAGFPAAGSYVGAKAAIGL